MRSPELTSMSRPVVFGKANVTKFFKFQGIVGERQVHNVADRTWKVDETVHKPRKILARCGAKQVRRITSGEKSVTTTAVNAVNAAGQLIPPRLIYKTERMTDLLLKGSPPGTIGGCGENRWVTSDLFEQWLKILLSMQDLKRSEQ